MDSAARQNQIGEYTLRPGFRFLRYFWGLIGCMGPSAVLLLIGTINLIRLGPVDKTAGAVYNTAAAAVFVLLTVASIAFCLWPVIYAVGARVVITPETVTKIYPLSLRTRTLSRSNLGKIDTGQVNVMSSSSAPMYYGVYSFRRLDGKVVFKLGTNWWGEETLQELVRNLQPTP